MERIIIEIENKEAIDKIVRIFFSLFTNKNGNKPDWGLINSICIPETLVIKKESETQTVYNLETFIEPRKKILSDGTLTEFQEKEIKEETKIIGNIAQRFSKYEKSGFLKDAAFHAYGNKFFQFLKSENGWRISSVIWEDDQV